MHTRIENKRYITVQIVAIKRGRHFFDVLLDVTTQRIADIYTIAMTLSINTRRSCNTHCFRGIENRLLDILSKEIRNVISRLNGILQSRDGHTSF